MVSDAQNSHLPILFRYLNFSLIGSFKKKLVSVALLLFGEVHYWVLLSENSSQGISFYLNFIVGLSNTNIMCEFANMLIYIYPNQ